MRLYSIELSGFKSFARRTQLDFSPGITAILGPNGQGKSNIADSIRWVLGEQSPKKMRSSTQADVLFSGNGRVHGARSAHVRLVFDNEPKRFPTDSPEIAIDRIMMNSGESEYLFNSDPIRLIDLQQMLSEAGIGPRTYTVISQGTIDQYLDSTPKHRRELFDEATGIRSLQLKLHESNKKLTDTQDHIREIQTILYELRPRLTVLQRQVERQHQSEALKKDLKLKKDIWYSHEWNERGQTLARYEHQMKELAIVIQKARTERKEIEQLLMQVPSHKASIASLSERLLLASRQYEMELASYEGIARDRKLLEVSIQALTEDLNATHNNYEKEHSTVFKPSWLIHTRSLLNKCKATIQQVLSGNKLEQENGRNLAHEIDEILLETTNPFSPAVIESLLKNIEKPLKESARLETLIQERQLQLRRLPALQKPSSDYINKLKAELAWARKNKKSHADANALEQARKKEVAAEREESVTQVAREQAMRELAELEHELLRERGSAFIRTMKVHGAIKAQKPSQEELNDLAQKIAILGEPDALALREYEEVKSRYESLTTQLDDIQKTAQNLLILQHELRQSIDRMFSEQFSAIATLFNANFQRLFGGGSARLSMTDEGIEISAIPPGKHTRSLALLSGGEKALASLALLLAIVEVQKAPFIVLDEVDAALDEANSSRLTFLLQEKASNTQLIVITHNRETMSIAKTLFGIMMTADGVSNVYSVKLDDVHEVDEKTKDVLLQVSA